VYIRPLLAVPACLAVLLTTGLTAGLSGATAGPTQSPGPVTGKTSASGTEARAALSDARAVLAGEAPPAVDATMALRRLWQLRGELTGADRAAADRLLARPDDETPGQAWDSVCTADNCYHWATLGGDAVATGDVDADGVPDYVKIALDLPDTGSAAVVAVYLRSGAPQVSVVPLSRTGAATRRVAFGSSKVTYVEVTLANAGTRYQCWTQGAYSCQGSSLDDGRSVRVRARAVR
jgi:hypothetical protein